MDINHDCLNSDCSRGKNIPQFKPKKRKKSARRRPEFVLLYDKEIVPRGKDALPARATAV